MGIESVNGAADYQAVSNKNLTKQVKLADAVDVSDTTVDVAASQAAAGQVAAVSESSKQSHSDADGDGKNNTQDKQPTMKDVKNINKIINDNTVAEFGYNEPTHRITIKIKDKETDEVIKEIPSEKALEMLAKAWELAGIMVDERR